VPDLHRQHFHLGVAVRIVAITIEQADGAWRGRLCNAAVCEPFSAVRIGGDTVVLAMADYNASITATLAGDSLTAYDES